MPGYTPANSCYYTLCRIKFGNASHTGAFLSICPRQEFASRWCVTHIFYTIKRKFFYLHQLLFLIKAQSWAFESCLQIKKENKSLFWLVGTSGLVNARKCICRAGFPATHRQILILHLMPNQVRQCFAYRGISIDMPQIRICKSVVRYTFILRNKKTTPQCGFFIGRNKWTRTTDPHLIRVVL